MTLSQAVSKRVRDLLKERNMSQYKLEMISGVNHGTMNTFMNGRYKSCNLTTLVLIIRALGITPKEFFDDPMFDDESMIIIE